MLGSTWHFGGHWILSILVNRLWCHWRHTHTRLTALYLGLPRWAGTRKVKRIWILLKQETVSGSGISWAICKSAPHSTPATHHSVFLQAGCPSCCPTNSVKALKAVNSPRKFNATRTKICYCVRPKFSRGYFSFYMRTDQVLSLPCAALVNLALR